MLSLSFVVSWLGSSDQFSAAIFLVSWWVRPGPYKSRLPSWHGPTFVVIIFRAIVIVRQNPKVPVVICTFPLIEGSALGRQINGVSWPLSCISTTRARFAISDALNLNALSV